MRIALFILPLVLLAPARADFLQEDRGRARALSVFDAARVEGLAIDAMGRPVAGSSRGLFREENGEWRRLAEGAFGKVKRRAGGQIFAAAGDRIVAVEEAGAVAERYRSALGPVGDFAVGENGAAVILAPLFAQESVTWQRNGKFHPRNNVAFHPGPSAAADPPPPLPIFGWSVAVDAAGTFWIGAKQGLLRREAGAFARVPGPGDDLWILGEKMEGLLVAGDGSLWYGNDSGISRYQPKSGAFAGMRPDTHGVPFPYARCLAEETDGSLWIGGEVGAARRDSKGSWSYYQGQAWLPHDGVLAIACGSDGRVFLGTESGLSVIARVPMTLARKAAHFEEVAEKHHFNRYDVVWQVSCKTPGDIATRGESGYTDNDGSWTADYLLGECLRWEVTRDPAARRNARRAMELMLRLETVTGIPGYPARAYTLASLHGQDPAFAEWHRSGDGQYLYKGDTSSDEIVGHYLAHSAYWDHAAEEAERPRLQERVRALTDHILAHGLTLVEREDGEATRWGTWSPERLWEWGHGWYSSRLWSLCILSHLKVAHHITGEKRYEEAYRLLIEKHDYARRTIGQKITFGEINHSDDQMAIMTYYPLLLYEKDPALRAIYLESLRASWEVERPERSPLWNFIYNWAAGNREEVKESLDHLRELPWELFDWSHDNTRRWDLPLKRLLAGKAESARALSMKERGPYYFTDNPYDLKSGDEGHTVQTPAIYLTPYWLGRFHGLIAGDE